MHSHEEMGVKFMLESLISKLFARISLKTVSFFHFISLFIVIVFVIKKDDASNQLVLESSQRLNLLCQTFLLSLTSLTCGSQEI